MSLEQYLEMDDMEIRELNGLGKEFTSETPNPFYKSANLDEIKDIEKMDDQYFHRDDT